MKNNKSTILLIILLSLTTILLTTFMVIMINKKINLNFNFLYSQRIEELQIDKTYEYNFDKINIKSDASDIEIKQSENDNISVKIYALKDTSSVTDNETELNIDVKQKKCIGICINKKISKVELYIPENYEKEINIETNYGDIKISSFEKLNLNIKEDAGDINIEKANIVDINNNYGDIKINEINNGVIKESAGDIEINKANNININNNMGDIKIEEINEYVEISGDAGDIKINNLNITKNSSIKTNAGDIKISNTNDIYIDSKTDIGDVKIRKNNKDAEIKLLIDNNLGDIKVN